MTGGDSVVAGGNSVVVGIDPKSHKHTAWGVVVVDVVVATVVTGTAATDTTITSSTTPISCEDRDDWYFIKGLNGSSPRLKDCRWIAKRSGRRCNKKLGAVGDEPSVLGYGSDERMEAAVGCSCACAK